MKISPINFLPNNSKNYFKSPENTATQQFFTKPDFKQKAVNFSGEYFRACLNIKNDFRAQKNNINFGNLYHKSISSTKPQYGLCECGYDDVDKFSREFAQKINSQIQNPSLEDVENLISNVKNATGADEKLVKEVIFRLSQFSTFKSMLSIEEELSKRQEYIPHSEMSDVFYEINLSSVFGYLASKFKFKDTGCPVIFIDDHSIKQYETGEVVPYYGNKMYILDGFDVLTRDNKYRGANFLSGTGHLEALAIDVIKQIQSGRDIEDIMHGSLEKRIVDFANNKNPRLYKNFKAHVIKKAVPANITSNDILNNLLENTLDSDYIKEKIKDKAKCIQSLETALMKYLDGFAFAFSAHSLSEIMNKMKSKMDEIEQKTGRENLYYCPGIKKSYNLISYMFMKNSGIDYDRVSDKFICEDSEGKNMVILDDSTISGKSQKTSIDDLEYQLLPDSEDDDFCPNLKLNDNVYYASVVSAQSTKDKSVSFLEIPDMIDFHEYLNSDRKEQTVDEIKERAKKSNLNLDDITLLTEILGNSCGNSETAIAFPYILPDNNSDFASDVLEPLLVRVTRKTRKS